MSTPRSPIVISWKKNPVRWCIFYWLVGAILGCVLMFFEEIICPLPVPNILKTVTVVVVFPVLVIFVSVRLHLAGRLE